MAKEIELKFLLAKGTSMPIPEGYKKVVIKQGYISVEKNKQVRVRITQTGKTDFYSEIGIKFTEKLIRDEFEFPIVPQDAKELYKKCKWTLEKTRLSFNSHVAPHVHYDVDTFPNGIQFVEVEFKSIKEMNTWLKNKPHWIGKEITKVSKYSNIVLAKKNLRF